MVITEWDQIMQADWPSLVQSMTEPRLVFDGRNCLDPEVIRVAGGAYVGVGRSSQSSQRYSVTPQG
jgi:UDPglucose 6-dehydrogenase